VSRQSLNDAVCTVRFARNIAVDEDKDKILESLRVVNTGFSRTIRHRSDVYNEILGYGIDICKLKRELGEGEFERLWNWLKKVNLQKIDITKLNL
jgi:hypothetical protein